MPRLDDDPLVEWMRDNGIEVTREHYIELNSGGEPERWTEADEAELPLELQDYTKVKKRDGR